MPSGNFTVGRDVQAVLMSPYGTRVDLSALTDISITAEHKTATSSRRNGPKIERFLPDGHRIKISLDRADAAVETIGAQIEAGWWSVGSADLGTSANGSLFLYITETNGSQTTHQFAGLAMKFDGLGDFKSETPVKQTIEAF